jgi:hypothetical protein
MIQKQKKSTWDPKNFLVQSYFLKQFENERTPKLNYSYRMQPINTKIDHFDI